MNNPYTYHAKVVRVIDGDTIAVNIDVGFGVWLHDSKEQNITKLRLAEVDAYETRRGSWTKDLTDEEVEERLELGKKAKQFVETRCTVGAPLLIHTEKAGPGKYGRYVAHVCFKWNNGEWTDLGQALLDAGLAVPYDK